MAIAPRPGARPRGAAISHALWSRQGPRCVGIATGVITRAGEPKARLMISEWELWVCANHYIREHGEDAAIIAAMRADELLAEGDMAGLRTFQAIVRRINQLMEKSAGSLH